MPLSKTELQDIRSLLTRKGRKQRGEFLAEGVRLMEEALRHEFRPIRVFYSESLLSERGIRLIGAYRRAQIEVRDIPASQLEVLADTDSPQGIVGMFTVPQATPEQLYSARLRKILVCENIGDPGNLGTLIRSALAFEMDLVVTIGSSAELFAPKVIRSSAGALFGMTAVHSQWKSMRELMRAHGAVLAAADLSGQDSVEQLRSLAAGRAIMLAVGSEATGLSEELVAQADLRVRINHSHSAESLNVAVAGSILMRELFLES